MLSHAYNIIIDHSVGALGPGIEVVNGLNATDKQFFSMLMNTVKLPSLVVYDTQMSMHTSTVNIDISLTG